MTQRRGWKEEVPTKKGWSNYKVLRCPPVRMRPYVILSNRVKFRGIHWAGGRSKPCEGTQPCPDCEESNRTKAEPEYCGACNTCEHCMKQQPTYKGYIAVYQPETGEKFVLEVTPPTFETFAAYAKLYGTLRGATVNLKRAGVKANGRMSANLEPSGIPQPTLPEDFSVEQVMDELWNMPNNPKGRGMGEVREEMAGKSAAEQLLDDLYRKGVIDSKGEPIPQTTTTHTTGDPQLKTTKTTESEPRKKPTEPKAKTPAQQKFLDDVAAKRAAKKFKDIAGQLPTVSPVYEATEEQKSMFEANRKNQNPHPKANSK